MKEYVAPGVDIRPMRWTTYEHVRVSCRYADPNATECYEIEVVHETTKSGYSPWSRYRICWRERLIRAITRLDSGVWGG